MQNMWILLGYHTMHLDFLIKYVQVVKRMSCGSMKVNTYLDLAIKILMIGVRTMTR